MSESRDDSLDKAKGTDEESGPESSKPSADAPPDQDLSWLMIPPTSGAERPVEPGDIDPAKATGPAPEMPAKVLPWEPPRGREPERKTPPEPQRERPPEETRSAESRQPPSASRPRPGGTARAEPPPRERSRSEPVNEPHSRATEEAGAEADALRRAAAEAQTRASRVEDRRDYSGVVKAVQRHLANGYSLLGLVGYSGSGKTHFLRALSLQLRQQGFEVAAWETFRKARVPGRSEAVVFDFPCTGPRDEKWVFVDAGGELYARLQANDWKLPEESAALLHSLYHCRGLFLLVHLQPGHFRGGGVGAYRGMSDDERVADSDAQFAQEELEFFDNVLLFLRALKAEKGNVVELVRHCATEPDLDKALRSYRDQAPQLDIPVMVLFSQADTFADSPMELATGDFLSPRKGIVNVTAFAARHLPGLFGSLVRHARRFKFDFVQSYEEIQLPGHSAESGDTLPKWDLDGELLSVGVLPALEFLQRNLPAEGGLRRFLQRWELETRSTLLLNRLLHPKQWWGVKVNP